MKTLSALLLIICFISSCHKDKIDEKEISQSQFPISTGDKWTYQVVDNLYGTTDTAVVVVISEQQRTNDTIQFLLQLSINGQVVDTDQITKSSTSFSYKQGNINSLFENLKITFPIKENSVWTGHLLTDTFKVLSIDQSRTILTVDYTNVTTVNRRLISPGYYAVGYVYISPDIGIVEQSLNISYGFPVKNQTIRLMKFEHH